MDDQRSGPIFRFEASHLGALFDALKAAGFRVIGPRLHQDAIVLDELNVPEDLPIGWGDEQEAGRYRLKRRADSAYFGYNLGPDSWKKFLSPRRQLLWRATQAGDALTIAPPAVEQRPYAFIGVRACELAAMQVQDRVREGHPREGEPPLLIGVTCAQAAATCFCASMGTGPALGPGYDLAITEFAIPSDHHFIMEVRSDRGGRIAAAIPRETVDEEARQAVAAQAVLTKEAMTRGLDLKDPAAFFQSRLDHPRWDSVASRCLSCANCTMVCPTCFCTTVEDTSDLSGDHAERWLRWDSCFHVDFSYLHGGSVRNSTRARYRQWLTHKLGTWHEQFGSSGCVGCGRCVAWCPVGIDLTIEVAALKASSEAMVIEGQEDRHAID